jgi:pimeloyl-ACP methyl ester carboxylesterase
VIARGARFVLQRLLFQAPGRVPPAELPPGGKLREAVARDRSVASFLHLEAPRSTTTLVYFHGGGTTLSDSLAAGVGLAQRGLSVALVEYRGYGGRPGTPHEAGCYLDGLAVLDALAADGCGPENVVLCGNSVGAAVALELATQRLGQRLVLLAPFLSARSLVAHWAPFVSADAIAGACFDNLGKAPRVHAATLVIHGERDRLVPPWMGRSLAAAIRGASFVSVPRAGHANLLKRHAGFVLDAIAAHATAG